MNWVTAIAVYFVTWWVVLFAVLPLGTKPVTEADAKSGWRGAPEHPQLLRKALITTVVSAVIWGGIYLLVTSGWISFRSGWLALPTQ
jgi:predicted secreted protein